MVSSQDRSQMENEQVVASILFRQPCVQHFNVYALRMLSFRDSAHVVATNLAIAVLGCGPCPKRSASSRRTFGGVMIRGSSTGARTIREEVSTFVAQLDLSWFCRLLESIQVWVDDGCVGQRPERQPTHCHVVQRPATARVFQRPL